MADPGPKIAYKGDKALIIQPKTGRRKAVDAETLEKVKRGEYRGWEPQTLAGEVAIQEEKEFQALPEQLKTAAVGAASGATLGLSTAALTEAGVVDPERQQLREHYNPELAVASEVVGGSLLGAGKLGGVRALGRAGKAFDIATAPSRAALQAGLAAERAVTTGARATGITRRAGMLGEAAAKATGYAAAGGIEGAMFGAGHALHEEAISGGNYEGLAERMWAGASEGATFGALSGAALGGTVGLGYGAGKKAIKGLTPELRALRDKVPGFKKVLKERADELGATAGDQAAWLAHNGKSLAESVPKGLRQHIQKVADESAAHAVAASKKELKHLADTNALRDVGKRLVEDDIVRAARNPGQMLNRAGLVKTQKREQMQSLLSRLDEAGELVDTANISRRLDRIIKKGTKSQKKAQRLAAHKIQQETETIRALGRRGKGVQHTELNRVVGELDDTLRNLGLEDDVVASQTIKDAKGLVEGELLASAPQASVKLKQPGWSDAFSDARKSYKAADWAERSLTDKIKQESVKGPIELHDAIHFAGHMAFGGPLSAIGGVAAHKFIKKHGRSIAADLLNRANKVDTQITKGMQRFFKKSRARAEQAKDAATPFVNTGAALGKRGKETTEQAFKRVAANVRSAKPPSSMALDFGAPKTGQAARVVAGRAITFLQSKLPASAHPPNPFYEAPDPHPDEIATFARYLKAVRDPVSAVTSLESGTLTSEEAEAVRAVYPSLYESMRTIAMELAVKHQGSLTHADRIQLGVLLDVPIDPSLDPESMRITQEAMGLGAAAEQQEQATPPPGAPAKPLADEFETEAQRLEQQEFAI